MEDTITRPVDAPRPPEPSRADYEAVIARLNLRLREIKQSGRWLEEQADLAAGTISKMKTGSGRVKLTRPKLDSIAKWLGVAPEALVEGTGFAALLTSAPPSPDRERIAALERDRDDLRTQRAELEAQSRRCADDLAKRDAELAQSRAGEEATGLAIGRVEAQNRRLQQELEQVHAEASQKGLALREHERLARGLGAQLDGLRAQLAEAEQQRDQWREHALDRVARVEQLELTLVELQERVRMHKPAEPLGALLLGGLIGLGLSSSGGSGSGSGRRR